MMCCGGKSRKINNTIDIRERERERVNFARYVNIDNTVHIIGVGGALVGYGYESDGYAKVTIIIEIRIVLTTI